MGLGVRAVLGLGVLVGLGLAGEPGWAQGNSADGLAAVLGEVPGCEGEKAETMSMTQGSTSYRWASRAYECGEGRLQAMVGVTPAAGAAAMSGGDGSQDMEMKSGSQLYRSSMVKGFRVVQTYNEDDKAGVLVVLLGRDGNAGSLVVQFEGMTLAEGTERAQRFDWAAMQKAAAAK